MSPTQFLSWFNQHQQQAVLHKQRQLIVLAGNINWSLTLIEQLNFSDKINDSELHDVDWHIYSDHELIKSTVNRQNYRYELGTESRFVLFCDSEFNLDALAALSGTIKAGGTLFILWPELFNDSLLIKESLFLQRFFHNIALHNHAIIQQGEPFKEEVFPTTIAEPKQEILAMGCVTDEQHQAVEAIIKVVTGHRNRPLVLTADRGRGKSSALAIACVQLLQQSQHQLHIVVTAPHRYSLDIFFNHLASSIPSATHTNNKVEHKNGVIEFLPVDVLLNNKNKPSLVLIDEAAGIPVYLLALLLEKYHRMVFSSTVHGYEGAGRGFTLKFQQQLHKQYPNFTSLHLNQPIRWSSDDPVEQFIYHTCLLNAKLLIPEDTSFDLSVSDFSCSFITANELNQNETLLSEVFSVLVTAHYQTSPNDLVMILDNPAIELVCVQYNNHVIAVCLIMKEGACHSSDVSDIKNGKRRLRNQFIPQSLLTHCGVDNAFDFDYLRVMRIAVHPSYQQQGVGRFLLDNVEQYAQLKKIDYLGASFGANDQLLSFWMKAKYHLTRIGFTKDAASGEHSALVLKAVNNKATPMLEKVNFQFYRTFDYLLLEEYQALPNKLVWLILHYCPKQYLPELTAFDETSVQAFAQKQRLYSSCVYSLHLWLKHQMSAELTNELSLLISKIFKKQPTEKIYQDHHLTGKKMLNQQIVNYVKQNL